MPENEEDKRGLARTDLDFPRIAIGAALLLALVLACFLLTTRQLLIGLALALAIGAIVAAGISKSVADPKDKVPATVILNIVIFLVIGLVTVSIYAARQPYSLTAAIIWSLATLAVGGSVGFLFGIPNAGPAANTPGGATQTPIEQIADWLTKIIVGVGLTNLKQLPDQLNFLGTYIATSIEIEAVRVAGDPKFVVNKQFGLGIAIYFCVLGVISGYLLTQIFLFDLINRRVAATATARANVAAVQNNPQGAI